MIEFNNGLIIIDKSWVDFKKLIDGTQKQLRPQHDETNEIYALYAVDDKIVYRHDIYKDGFEPQTWEAAEFTNNATSRAEFLQGYMPLFNKQLVYFDADGSVKTASELPQGDKVNVISINWCDKCSWYPNSIKVTDETLIDTGDGKRFKSQHEFWIDLTHGRVTYEDQIAKNANTYIPIISVDGAVVDSDTDTDGYYEIDYEKGEIVFSESQIGKNVISTYWYAVNGEFTVKPIPGKKLKILLVEVQFSKQIKLNDSMYFQAYGYAGVFAPQLVPAILQATDLIPLGDPIIYKRMVDYINEANGSFPIIPMIGNGSWRGLKDEIVIFQWRYLARTDLHSSYGMEVRVGLIDSIAHEGELATATFYALSADEV